MKKFILKILLFGSICGILFYSVFYFADGSTDGLYLKFTTPRQSSLILGTSKATQGLQPKIINSVLDRTDIYNYAFTVVHSPYGPSYFNSIKKKLDSNSRNGIFILQVDPYSISSLSKEANDSLNFRENDGAVGDIKNVNIKPNLEYLIWHYPFQYIFIYKRKLDAVGHGFLHDDGWVEMTVSMDVNRVQKRTISKTKTYLDRTKNYKYSSLRLEYLKKTVEFLKEHGRVVLVRLPIAKPLFEIEESLIPDFDIRMENLASQFQIDYFNYKEEFEKYTYIDGNHLTKESGAELSRKLAKELKNN